MEKKILYIMHVSWGWIKQRPHFLAEGLSQKYDVTVITNVGIRDKNILNKGKENSINFQKIYTFPFSRFKLIKKISDYYYRNTINRQINKNDIIWFTSPNLLLNVKDNCFINKTIIYDAMDDMLAFPGAVNDQKLKSKLFDCEKILYQSSKIVFVSSENLKNKLISRYGFKNLNVVNNAIIPKSGIDNSIELRDDLKNYFSSSNKIKLMYVGTISAWIDFEILILLLDKYEELEIVLFGPCDVVLPKHNRLIIFGPVEHKYIFKIMECSDAMIMPFIVNELIESVNPVKLYEYIYSYKPCISVGYDETRKFEEFVYLYYSHLELTELIKQLISKKLQPKKNRDEIIEFCSSNTWAERTETILNILEKENT